MGLKNVKVGDKLIMTTPWARRIITVEKVLKIHVVASGYKFRKADGSQVSSNPWTCTSARLATEEDIQNIKSEIRHKKLAEKCNDINFNALSDAQLEQILKIANNGTGTNN